MRAIEIGTARAAADLSGGFILATVEVRCSPERVFKALTSNEICKWWVRAGVFDTREWTGDVRVGGHWRAAGVAGGHPYVLEGEFLEVEPPRRLVHTWRGAGVPGTSKVTYSLDAIDGGTRLTVRHSDFATREATTNNCLGWETSLEKLVEILEGRR